MAHIAREHEVMLGPDLVALVHGRPERLVTVAEISTLRSSLRRRAAFRLEFDGNVVLKGRRLDSPERSRRIQRILELAGEGFPRPIDRRGEALLLPWIEGRTLATLEPIPAPLLARCGRILGGLHQLGPPAWWTLQVPGPVDLLRKLHRDLAILVAAGALGAGLARAAVATAAAAAPRDPRAGVIHKDFCAENIVLDTAGAPVSIDNANLTVGPCDLDLARTWYRWPMSATEWRCFSSAYEEHRSTAAFRTHFAFWAVCVLAGSASSRLRAHVGRHREPLARLETLLDAGGADRMLLA